ncbi:MAG: NUDIX domain-containing protein [Candidatus Nealsonbacteria bacterium DGGOD1a]|jgi:ADP-ribose pyrophosphatase|nr:MAG: NUDIX domain-containing protein [Candidatus Nealsonbacteria bacterium DGGOD1a]
MEKPAGKIIMGNVCFIIDRKNNKVLLLKRNRAPMQSMYTGVGGKTLSNESPFDSCVREAKEETGLDISEVKLKGAVKTILDGGDSSWILSVYTAGGFCGEMIECGEGKLEWVDINSINSRKLIGFIEKIMPYILDESVIFDGVIIHDIKGNVIKDSIKTYSAQN